MSDFDERARRAAGALRNEIGDSDIDLERGARRARQAGSRNKSVKVTSWLAVAVAALTVGVAVDGGRNANPPIAINNGEGPFKLAASLQAFGSCDELLGYFKEHGSTYTNTWNYGSGTGRVTVDIQQNGLPGAGDSSSKSVQESAPSAPPQVSQTNVQEVGIDEPDTIKSDGRRIVVVNGSSSGAKAHVSLLELENGKPVLRATLSDVSAKSVLLSEDRLLVLSLPTEVDNPDLPDLGRTPQSSVLLYDIDDLAKPKLLSKLNFDGEVVDARMVGSDVRLVTRSHPRIVVPTYFIDTPSPVRGQSSRPAQEDVMKDSIGKSKIEQWLPRYTLHDGSGNQIENGLLTTCDKTAVPTTFSGLDVVTVATFDISDKIDADNALGVVAGGETVYASRENLYVSQVDYKPGENASTTHLHKFSSDENGNVTYRASGDVDGNLLNQYSMSERDDVLRVATTWSHGGGRFSSAVTEGVVTTLEESGNKLIQKGRLAGLGREDNESIKSVRFIDNKGYVVTFRQTDPLFVIDLDNPSEPKILGELKIPGYSGYLHPLSNDRLLGVGQNGSNGARISLFDVRDSKDPKQLATYDMKYANSVTEYDAKAFLYWQPRELVVTPMMAYDNTYFNGVVLLKVDDKALTEKGRIAHDAATSSGKSVPGIAADSSELYAPDYNYREPITRSLVIDNNLYTLSDSQLVQTSLDTLTRLSSLKFAQPQSDSSQRTVPPTEPSVRPAVP